ncbi:MAG: ATP-binding protein [Lentisphaeria bacterium]|jgi:hypothetical protein|nr:ATP-binding protein [Lentisphaeria bacterium]
MMQDISLHLMDVLENSAKAGAKNVRVDFAWSDARLRVRIEDDGPGLPPEIAADPTDPYRTTRRERPVGLGLAFLRQSAEATGGRLGVDSTPGKGVVVTVEFVFGGADAKPLGDLPGVLAMTTVAWPELDLRVTVHGTNLVLDMKAVKAELDGVPLDHPAVRVFVGELLEGGLSQLMAWGGQEFALENQATEAQEGRAGPAGRPAGGHTPPSVFP